MSEFGGKRTLGKPSRRWDGNNKTELKERKKVEGRGLDSTGSRYKKELGSCKKV